MVEFATNRELAVWLGPRQLRVRQTAAGSVQGPVRTSSVCGMRPGLMILFLLLGVGLQAAQLTPLPDLRSAAAGDEKRVSEIAKISLAWWLKNRGVLAEESFKVAGYFSVARPIAKFAARDDRVWEVRVVHLHTGGPTGIVWINDKTDAVIALGVEEKEEAELIAPAKGASPRR